MEDLQSNIVDMFCFVQQHLNNPNNPPTTTTFNTFNSILWTNVLITARIGRVVKVMLSVCLSVRRGLPQSLVPGPFWEITLSLYSQVLFRGYRPILSLVLSKFYFPGRYPSQDKGLPSPQPGQESECLLRCMQ